MVKEAEANAEADKQRRGFVELRNQSDGLIHQVEKNLQEHGDKLPAQDKGEAEAAVAAARSAMEGTDADALKQATERLSQAAMKIGEVMYKSQQSNEAADAAAAAGAAGQHGQQGPGGKPDEKVVDAEFEEVDEKKKKSA
jgi:molecular chaperone DnaK